MKTDSELGSIYTLYFIGIKPVALVGPGYRCYARGPLPLLHKLVGSQPKGSLKAHHLWMRCNWTSAEITAVFITDLMLLNCLFPNSIQFKSFLTYPPQQGHWMCYTKQGKLKQLFLREAMEHSSIWCEML